MSEKYKERAIRGKFIGASRKVIAGGWDENMWETQVVPNGDILLKIKTENNEIKHIPISGDHLNLYKCKMGDTYTLVRRENGEWDLGIEIG